MYKALGKAILDRSVAIMCILISLPFFLVVPFLLILCQNEKFFFSQTRPGKNMRLFELYKFKTMLEIVDENGDLGSDEDRLTSIGKLLRKLSLDELPQLWNVIKGDMSLVGPRPLLVEYLPLYNRKQNRRHEVKPGITGWAQVNGRNAISWEQKFEYDVWYVDHMTFWLDIKIIFLTIAKVFRREGISSQSSVTMEKFQGNG